MSMNTNQIGREAGAMQQRLSNRADGSKPLLKLQQLPNCLSEAPKLDRRGARPTQDFGESARIGCVRLTLSAVRGLFLFALLFFTTRVHAVQPFVKTIQAA